MPGCTLLVSPSASPSARPSATPSLLVTMLPVLLASACFDVDPREQPVAGGSIVGQITVSSTSGQSVVNGDAVRAQRAAVARANQDAAGNASVTTVGRPTGRGAPDRPSVSGSKVPLEWAAGDVLVLFEDRAYTDKTLASALRRMLHTAQLSGVSAEIVRCTGQRYCKAVLTNAAHQVLDAEATADAAARLHKVRAPGVKVVTRNMKKYGMRVPNDPLVGFQWHYNFIHMAAAWDIEIGDPEIVIAIVDSGLVQAHPDISGRIARDPVNNTLVGADLLSHTDLDLDDRPGRDTNPEDPGDNLFGDHSSFHGTHIAGTIGAESDNGEGVAGITWQGQLLPVRVLGSQLGGFDDDIMDGLFWAVGDPAVQGVPANVKPARLVNMSFGGPAADEANQAFWNDNIQHFLDDPDNIYNNPILVAAAGNSDADAADIVPANVPGMIAVGATNIEGLRASYSNYGPIVDIMAPGGDTGTDLNSDGQPDTVLSTIDVNYDYREGTSMATPHVLGVAALLVAANPTLTQPLVESILKSSADQRGRCSEGCGAGWLDAVSALLLAGGEIQLEPFLTVDNSQAFFLGGQQVLTLRVLNLGNAPLDFTTEVLGAQADLFTVSPASGTVPEATANGVVTLTVTLSRGAFDAGSANLRISTTSADISPPQVVNVDLGFNDDTTRAPRSVNEVEVAAYKRNSDGSLKRVGAAVATRANDFAYEIKGVRAGDYFVYAVGDDNQDGTFAADFESFGAYPTRTEPRPVTVEDKKATEGIDLTIDGQFITGVLGGVGSPCGAAGDCTFDDDAACIDSFESGYCTRPCDDGFCGPNATCEELECDGTTLCKLCLENCANDNQCRFAEGYVCDLGACVPDFLATR